MQSGWTGFWEVQRGFISAMGLMFTIIAAGFLWAVQVIHRAEKSQYPAHTPPFWTPGMIRTFAFVGCIGLISAYGFWTSFLKPRPQATAQTEARNEEEDQYESEVPRAEIKVLNVRVSPSTGADGALIPMVYVDWKNIGSVPITRVKADVLALDAQGRELNYHARDYYLFLADGAAPIQPGQSYYEPGGQGHFLLPTDGVASRARIRITEVSDKPSAY